MCGRFTLRTPAYKLAEAFGVEVRANLAPRYNVAPSQDVAAVRRGEAGGRDFAMLRWGLIPYWARDAAIGNKLINARAETVAEKPSFRAAFRKRRCLVVADGFYEWRKAKDGKQPWLIAMGDGEPFAIAGLWESWKAPGGETVESCTLITTEANATVTPIHHRMPAILGAGDYDAWLDPAPIAETALAGLLRPYPAEEMTARAVGRLVNNARNEDPACIEPLGETLPLLL